MKNQNIKFNEYVNMIRSRAHYYSKCYNVEYDDLEAQGYLIYTLALKDYQKKKSSFSTYLFRNLSGRLKDYCKQKQNREHLDLQIEDVPYHYSVNGIRITDSFNNINFDLITAKKETETQEKFLIYAHDYLSVNTYRILKWILEDQLIEFRIKKTPSMKILSSVLGMNIDLFMHSWNELKIFWNYKGYAFYAEN